MLHRAKAKEEICTQCYEVSKPIYLQKGGTWPVFILLYVIHGIVIFPITLLWLVFLFVVGILGLGSIFRIGNPSIFPLLHYMPQSPYIVKICKHCGAVSKMVALTCREGIDAYEWHQKTFFLKTKKDDK
jgi:ribosomal protein L40E